VTNEDERGQWVVIVVVTCVVQSPE